MQYIADIILYVGAVQGVLLSLFLFSIKVNKLSNRLLALLSFLLGIFLLAYALQDEGLYVKFPHLLKVFYQFLFIFFPLIYLHAKYLLADIKKFQKKDLLHFIPFFISVILYSDFFFRPAAEKLEMIRNKSEYYRILDIIGDEFIAVQGIVYSIITLIMIGKYRKNIQDYESSVEKKLIQILYIGISLDLFAWIIGSIGIQFKYIHIQTDIDFFTFTYLVFVVVIYVVSYAAIKSPEIFKIDRQNIRVVHIRKTLPGLIKKEPQPLAGNIVADTEERIVADKELVETEKRLQELMEVEKPFLNPDITLPDLAKTLEVSRNHLSGVINQIHGMNFYQFVNRYRVEEVKKLMDDPANSNLKLISLAYDAGFNSKASFNRIFKQFTNMTPSEYYASRKKAG